MARSRFRVFCFFTVHIFVTSHINPKPIIYADTETTGVNDTDEILEMAIVDELGNVLLHTYVTPTHMREWPEAQKRNNISPEFIFSGGFPTVDEIREQVIEILKRDDVVLYNVDYDRPVIERMFNTGSLLDDALCCMDWFAKYRGEPATEPYHKNGFRSWKLKEAAEFTGFYWEGKPYGALADAKATHHVWNWLMDASGIEEDEDWKERMGIQPKPFPGEPDPMTKLTDEELLQRYQTDDEREEYRIERAVRREEL